MSAFNSSFAAASLILVGLIAGAYYLYAKKLETPSLLQPQNTAIVANGKTIYRSNCASCHGAQLEGQPNWRTPNSDLTMPAPPHNKRGHTWHHNDQILFDLTKYGLGKIVKQTDFKTNMPAYDEQLSDQQIIAVLSYIKSTWPEEVRRRHDQLNAQSKEGTK